MVAGLELRERCSYARSSLTTVKEGEEDLLFLLGDEHTHVYRLSLLQILFFVEHEIVVF